MNHVSLAWPFPPSVNSIWRSRRGHGGKPSYFIDRRYASWKRVVDNLIMATVPRPKIRGNFTASITLDERRRGTKDADNFNKAVMDALQRCEIVENDKLADSVTVRWGWAPEGCRIDLRPSVSREHVRAA